MPEVKGLILSANFGIAAALVEFADGNEFTLAAVVVVTAGGQFIRLPLMGGRGEQV